MPNAIPRSHLGGALAARRRHESDHRFQHGRRRCDDRRRGRCNAGTRDESGIDRSLARPRAAASTSNATGALDDIDSENVERLGLGWSADIPSLDGLSATPLVVDGTIYLSSSYANVFALDARTGEMRWHHNPATEPGHSFSGGWTSRINRGVAVWEGKVFVASGDCRLIALNAATGQEVWTTRACDPTTDGMDGRTRVLRTARCSSVAASQTSARAGA